MARDREEGGKGRLKKRRNRTKRRKRRVIGGAGRGEGREGRSGHTKAPEFVFLPPEMTLREHLGTDERVKK